RSGKTRYEVTIRLGANLTAFYRNVEGEQKAREQLPTFLEKHFDAAIYSDLMQLLYVRTNTFSSLPPVFGAWFIFLNTFRTAPGVRSNELDHEERCERCGVISLLFLTVTVLSIMVGIFVTPPPPVVEAPLLSKSAA
ncbi:hypothetical protein DOY81_013521, partial [Sarcophaga bullata]